MLRSCGFALGATRSWLEGQLRGQGRAGGSRAARGRGLVGLTKRACVLHLDKVLVALALAMAMQVRRCVELCDRLLALTYSPT